MLYQLSYGNISCRVQESNLQRSGYEPDALPVELTQRKRMPACNARCTSCITGGKSIFEYDSGGKVAQAYRALTKEVLQLEKQRQKAKSDLLR